MNRRGFMGALAASGLIPFMPKPDAVNVRLRYHKPVLTEELVDDAVLYHGTPVPAEDVIAGYLDRMRLNPDGTMTTTGDGTEGERVGIMYTVYDLPDGSRLRVPHP